ncbi:Rv1733c family protein [Actinoplanes utahensis]|uniref:Rv1733c family protein n=1 Tax=Actinoplanes utahensis TaxID=1869 RepID=UPI00068C4B87|nr:hypothetical protein [Actinoplanes utahensis]GIF30189.1 hypothetical protein Aut01nite_31750 [Actinoplanes utahensis]
MFARKPNPLRRGSDRFEAGMLLSLFVCTLLAAPILAWWAAGVSYRADQQAIAWERQNVFRVEAELMPGTDPGTEATPGWSRASWTAPNGTKRSGLVTVVAGQRPGDRVMIWVERDGDQRGAPGDRSPVARAALIAVVVVAAVAAAMNALRRLGTAVLERHRARGWQREWSEVGPRWSRDLLP